MIWKSASILAATSVAQRELFTTTRTQICSTFCLNQGDVFCANAKQTSGACFSGKVPPENPELVCSNRFAHAPQVACPFEQAVCGPAREFSVNDGIQLI
jgi:hypothetical protein